VQAQCFFLWGEGERCWIFIVPMKFWMGPQHVTQVPNVFPNISPIALTSSHMFCPKFYVTYITNPKEEITTYLFWECPMLEYYFFGHGSIKDVHHKREKKKKKIELSSTPQLSSMSHNDSMIRGLFIFKNYFWKLMVNRDFGHYYISVRSSPTGRLCHIMWVKKNKSSTQDLNGDFF
jgi:hypothetical protein